MNVQNFNKRGKKKTTQLRASKRKSKTPTPIRFDEDGKTEDAGEDFTVLGDPSSVNMLGLKINDGKSRDGITLQG